MRPWLLNILACPMDKHHPLEAYFFTWETDDQKMKAISLGAGEVSHHFRKGYGHLAKQIRDGTISPPAIRAIRDLSESEYSKLLLEKAIEAIGRLEAVGEISEDELLRGFGREIDVLYRFLNLIEVDEGLLVCTNCGRWYPIGSAVETIPELLPDELRDKDKDLSWMEKWRRLIPINVVEDGKPFNLRSRS
ncbi:hypothetical protein KEJ49_07410 [Candidatus Bathyarchaeota archaeon]|nr:hypothetical protein [Candidatus Bathyarchaeota archaeon]